MREKLHRVLLPSLASIAIGVCGGCTARQASPAETLELAYQYIADQEYSDLCDLLTDSSKRNLSLMGGCETAVANQFAASSDRYSKVRVDSDRISIEGDLAFVEAGAVTVDGVSVRGFTRLVQRENKWWIAG